MQTHNVTKIEINLDNVTHNYRELKRFVAPAEVVPVVKSEAYGHGAVPLSRLLESVGCQHLAISMVDEGIQLRVAGIKAKIMVLGVTLPEQFAAMAKYELTPSLGSITNLEAWAEQARRLGRRLPFHLKVDIGLGRLGFMPEQAEQVLEALRGLPEIELSSISSHLSHPEGSSDHNEREFARYQQFCQPFLAAYPDTKRHLAASEAILRHPSTYFDLVRVGGLLYGFDYGVPTSLNLKPVLTYMSKVGQVKTLEPGWGAFYGIERLIQQPTRVALLPVGWSDGLSKTHLDRAKILIRGQFATLIGVCTDFTIFDVTHIPQVAVGDEAILVGRQGNEEQTALQLARAGGMSAAELLGSCSLRVARVYIKDGERKSELSILSS